ncbi:MAG: OpgC domain-containing protein [Casimicrobiaceae bacterium]
MSYLPLMSPLVVSPAFFASFRTGMRERVRRRSDLDWLRGLMLILMTVTHLPTVFSARFGQPFGFVSAAEGFVFLSAFLVGSVYGRMARERGDAPMRRALLGRALTVYAVHVALLLFLFFVLVPLARSRGAYAITDLASFYLSDPGAALAGGLLLVYNPPLLDILPMYVVFLALSPWALRYSSRHGWTLIFAASLGVWLFSQFDGGRAIYDRLATALGFPGEYAQTGAFVLLAWQLLWFAGLCAGARANEPVTVARGAGGASRGQRALLWTAVAVAGVLFAWRHLAGQVPSADNAALNALFDKWHLGPLRILNFAALAVLAVHFRHVLVAWAQDSSIARMGRASLAVFSAHLVLCLSLLATVGDDVTARSGVVDAALLTASLVTLYVVAKIALRRSKGLPGEDAKDRGAERAGGAPAAIPETAQ